MAKTSIGTMKVSLYHLYFGIMYQTYNATFNSLAYSLGENKSPNIDKRRFKNRRPNSTSLSSVETSIMCRRIIENSGSLQRS